MLATFIIALREGVEAALIVGIVAAFLRRNGRPLTPMWIGVGAAILLSLLVGVGLAVLEQALPQAAQEGLETVIGAVAILFVTGMVLWMNRHARGLKQEIEASARDALGDGTSRALVAMAFLAVLKEGFETSVFLLATFQAASNTVIAALGALLGLLGAVIIGVGLYRGGLRINLSRFFRATGVFLVLVAAGLVVSALRTAHEATWLNAGQQRTLDLSWLAPLGSIRGALFTGVLGIPPDPRLVEVVGWLCYLIPMLAIVAWPPTRKPGPVATARLKQALAALAVAGAAALAVLLPAPSLPSATSAPLVDAAGEDIGTATLDGNTLVATLDGSRTDYQLTARGGQEHDGTPAEHLAGAREVDAASLPSSLTLAELTTLNGGRLPVGVNPQLNPGPYTAEWTSTGTLDVWTAGDALLDAAADSTLAVTLTGGGLSTQRTVSVTPGTQLPGAAGAQVVTPANWTVAPSHVDEISRAVSSYAGDRHEYRFWGRFVPLLLLLTAALLLVSAARPGGRSPRTERSGSPGQTATPRTATPPAATQHATPAQPASGTTTGRNLHAR